MPYEPVSEAKQNEGEEKEKGEARLESPLIHRYRFFSLTPKGFAISKGVDARTCVECSAKVLKAFGMSSRCWRASLAALLAKKLVENFDNATVGSETRFFFLELALLALQA